MRRRGYLTGVTAVTVALAGCSLGVDDDDDDDDGVDLPGEVIDAEPDDVLVRAEDLPSGWRVIEAENGAGRYFHSENNLSVTVEIDKHGDVEAAVDDFESRKQAELDEGLAVDEVEYGNDGFLLLADGVLGKIVFVGGDFVVEVQALLYDDASVELDEEARTFAEIVEEHIDDQ